MQADDDANHHGQLSLPTVSQHPNPNLPPTTWRARVKGLLSGGVLVTIGYWLISDRVHVFIGRYHQPIFSYSFVAAGIVVILVSAAPSLLIIKMTALKKYRPYQAGYHAHGESINRVAEASTERQSHENLRP
jgi:hypothetical protein